MSKRPKPFGANDPTGVVVVFKTFAGPKSYGNKVPELVYHAWECEIVLPNGKRRLGLDRLPRAAFSHSASVGSR